MKSAEFPDNCREIRSLHVWQPAYALEASLLGPDVQRKKHIILRNQDYAWESWQWSESSAFVKGQLQVLRTPIFPDKRLRVEALMPLRSFILLYSSVTHGLLWARMSE